MARKAVAALEDMSIAQLKKLLAARENVEALESRRAAILAELAKLDREIGRVETSWGRKPGRQVGGKAGRKKTARRKAAKKAAPVARPRKARKKAGRPVAKRKVARKAGKPTLETVIVKVLGRRRMAFQDLLAKIQKDKLVTTKSKNFANVLRRTLSTSSRVKRVGRGVYAVE